MPGNVENIVELKPVSGEQAFNSMLACNKAIVYISVDWSGQERISRAIFYKVLNELKIVNVPIFKIDCSEQEEKYIENWLRNQQYSMLHFNGYGELLLMTSGKIIDIIKYPGQSGIENVKMKIEECLR